MDVVVLEDEVEDLDVLRNSSTRLLTGPGEVVSGLRGFFPGAIVEKSLCKDGKGYRLGRCVEKILNE